MEKRAYKALRPLQGVVISHYCGEAVYHASPALVLPFITGRTLFKTWQDLEDGDLRRDLRQGMSCLELEAVKDMATKHHHRLRCLCLHPTKSDRLPYRVCP